jgi:hypothetical protein
MTTIDGKEVFHRVIVTLDRVKDLLFSRILERDHIDDIRGVNELIEEHNEEQVKYILGKMCLDSWNDKSIRKSERNSGWVWISSGLETNSSDRVKRLTVAEHELQQMQIQLDDVQKENMMIKWTNT